VNFESYFKMVEIVIIAYFFLVNLSYVILFIIGLNSIIKYFRRKPFSGAEIISRSKSTLPISILVPACNEEQTIIDNVKALLKLNYPKFEIIVINDGSTDGTFNLLRDEFNLIRSNAVFQQTLKTEPVHSTYSSMDVSNLFVINKKSCGNKADALNAGLNFSKFQLYCAIDADTIIENNALVRMVKPLLDSTEVVAVGGIVRVANGSEITEGEIKKVRTPRSLIANFQIIEYLRAFLTGRSGWSAMNSLLIISGAFGLFRKAAVMEVGGYRVDTIGEDAELVVRMHRIFREKKRKYQIKFVADPICWTEAPENLKMLFRQRERWHKGLFETIRMNRKMIFNPKYGRIGMLALPYFLIFELLGPIFEIGGFLLFLVAFLTGFYTAPLLLLFIVASILFGTLLSIGALFIEEYDFNRYEKWTDVGKLIFFAFVENFGFRQLLAFIRLRALLFIKISSWELIPRKGFAKQKIVPDAK